MDKPCGRSSAAPLVVISVAIRLIWSLTIDNESVYNAAWQCPIIGFILFLPAGLAIKALSREINGCAFSADHLRRKPVAEYSIAGAAFLLLIFDASANVHLLSNSASVMALAEAPVWLVSLPIAVLVFVCVLIGMEAAGRSARLWIRMILPLLAIMIIVQFRSYRPEWLTPVFGGGLREIIRGGLRCAGHISLLSLAWLVCVEDTCHKSVIPYAFAGTISASLVLALLSMLSPALIRTTLSRSAQIELILSNGRVHLMLQLLMVILWFACLLHLVNAECTCAAVFIKQIIPACPKWLSAACIASLVFIGTITGIGIKKPFSSIFADILFPVICVLLLLLYILFLLAKRRSERAKTV